MTQAAVAPARTGWTGELWAQMEPIFDSIVAHPFIAGLTTGDLPPEVFLKFLDQDAHYVREYAKALAALGAKAPDRDLVKVLLEHALGAVTAESTLHAELSEMLGGDSADLEGAEPSPTTEAYVNFIVATVHAGSFVDGLAVMLPCMWVYGEVGAKLVDAGSPHPAYQKWIDNYAGGDYAEEVVAILDVVDRVGQHLNAADRERAAAIAVAATRYEWMFWDSAFRGETWPSP